MIDLTAITRLSGNWTVRGNEFEFAHAEDGFGIALTGTKAARGTFRVNVTLKDASQGCAGIVIGYDPEYRTGLFVSIGGWESAYSIGRFVVDGGAVALAMMGRKSVLVPDRPYELGVKVEGVVISFAVDGATVMQHRLPRPLLMQQVGLYAYGMNGNVLLRNFRAEPAQRQAFVVIPFREPFETFWSEVIQPVARTCEFEAYRAKDVYKPGVIIADVLDGLETSDVVIADVGSLNPQDAERYFNPNVYYEVGYAHRAGTPVILMADQRTLDGRGLPFDIHHFRCIGYSDTIAGKREVEEALRQHLRSIA